MCITKELLEISKQISFFIKEWLIDKNNFESRTFYGSTFSLALLERTGYLQPDIKEKLLNAYKEYDKKDSQFHWEFNNYALLQYHIFSGDKDILELIYPLKFKNTPCTNWTLLRSNSRFIADQDSSLALKEAKGKIKRYQLKSGLILDDRNVKSFQYHCFSMAMIAEMFEKTGDKDFYISFISGVDFIRKFILSSGDTIYIGRGQRQSFGYGALIYILALAYKYTKDSTIIGDLNKIVTYLKKFQLNDGSFPLVMNGIKQGIPKVVDIKDTIYAGWYPYNNYFDYLPFMGFFISKAHEVLKDFNIEKSEYSQSLDYCDNNYIKKVTSNYEAVVARTGGYWTNDMPIPYIVSKDKNITPTYGGEQFQKSIYNMKGLPLPYFKVLKKSIRWRGISFIKKNTLWVISPLGIMKRKFNFLDSSILINTKVYSIFNYINIYLFDKESAKVENGYIKIHNVCIDSNKMIESEDFQFSADGKLIMFEDSRRNSTIEFNFERG